MTYHQLAMLESLLNEFVSEVMGSQVEKVVAVRNLIKFELDCQEKQNK